MRSARVVLVEVCPLRLQNKSEPQRASRANVDDASACMRFYALVIPDNLCPKVDMTRNRPQRVNSGRSLVRCVCSCVESILLRQRVCNHTVSVDLIYDGGGAAFHHAAPPCATSLVMESFETARDLQAARPHPFQLDRLTPHVQQVGAAR